MWRRWIKGHSLSSEGATMQDSALKLFFKITGIVPLVPDPRDRCFTSGIRKNNALQRTTTRHFRIKKSIFFCGGGLWPSAPPTSNYFRRLCDCVTWYAWRAFIHSGCSLSEHRTGSVWSGCGDRCTNQKSRFRQPATCSERPPRSLWCVAWSSIKARGECQERCFQRLLWPTHWRHRRHVISQPLQRSQPKANLIRRSQHSQECKDPHRQCFFATGDLDLLTPK